MEKWRSRVGSLPVCINKATGHPRALKKLRLSGGSYLDRLLSNTCENFRLISISMHLAAISTFFPHFMFVTLGGKVSSVRRWGAYNFERRCHLLPHDVKNQFWWVFFCFLSFYVFEVTHMIFLRVVFITSTTVVTEAKALPFCCCF